MLKFKKKIIGSYGLTRKSLPGSDLRRLGSQPTGTPSFWLLWPRSEDGNERHHQLDLSLKMPLGGCRGGLWL